MKFGHINKIPLRDIWQTEDKHFTPWLEKNIDILSEELGIQIEIEGREASVGDFSLDLLGRDVGNNTKVIIENQFGPTDHDHLGKLLTYASAYEASAIIWITESVRDEHKQALEWLNKRTDYETDFFIVTVEVFRIDESIPTVRFVPVVFPNEWQKGKKLSSSSKQPSERGIKYYNYFQSIVNELREKYHFTSARRAGYQSWVSFASGISDFQCDASFNLGKKFRVECYIGKGDRDQNKQIFDHLYSQKEEIEKEFGDPLSWQRLDTKKASRVAIIADGSIKDSDEKLNEYKEWMIKNLLKMKSIMPKYLIKE